MKQPGSIELNIKNDHEITLPGGIVTAPLNLTEIGAITCMLGIAHDPPMPLDAEAVANRLKSPEMVAALKSLKERRLLEIVCVANTVTIRIDLEAVGL